jgi:hypothetical protein
MNAEEHYREAERLLGLHRLLASQPARRVTPALQGHRSTPPSPSPRPPPRRTDHRSTQQGSPRSSTAGGRRATVRRPLQAASTAAPAPADAHGRGAGKW